jgi:hypothetical protein
MVGKDLPKMVLGWQIRLLNLSLINAVYFVFGGTPDAALLVFGQRTNQVSLWCFRKKIIAESMAIELRKAILGTYPNAAFSIRKNTQTGVAGQAIVHGIARKMLAIVPGDPTHGCDPQVPLWILTERVGLRLNEAMLYIAVDEVVFLRPQTHHTDPTKYQTEYFFHPVDSLYLTQKITSRFFDRVLNRKLTLNEPFDFLFKTQNREVNFSALLISGALISVSFSWSPSKQITN